MIYVMKQCLNLFLADTIVSKWTRAQEGIQETETIYEELTNCLNKSWIEKWTRSEQKAMDNRGEDLQIYVVASEKSKVLCY